VLRPAFQFVKLAWNQHSIGRILYDLKDNSFGDDGLLVFGTAQSSRPDEKQLAEIAVSTARTTDQSQESSRVLQC
jgi:phosphotransacetylase